MRPFAAAGYASPRGQRDFASTAQLVASRYDVLSEPRHAKDGGQHLARLALTCPPIS
ncbi:hypothetical protein [Actinopolymorpha pittospori]